MRGRRARVELLLSRHQLHLHGRRLARGPLAAQQQQQGGEPHGHEEQQEETSLVTKQRRDMELKGQKGKSSF